MSTQNTTVDTIKEQIHVLVEQLQPGQLLALHHALQTWATPAAEHGANGAPTNGMSLATEALIQEQPWRKYTARLKGSPNWDEFLETLAAARQETHPTED